MISLTFGKDSSEFGVASLILRCDESWECFDLFSCNLYSNLKTASCQIKLLSANTGTPRLYCSVNLSCTVAVEPSKSHLRSTYSLLSHSLLYTANKRYHQTLFTSEMTREVIWFKVGWRGSSRIPANS